MFNVRVASSGNHKIYNHRNYSRYTILKAKCPISKFTNYMYIHLDVSLEPDIASYKDSIIAILPIQTSMIIIQTTEHNYVILEWKHIMYILNANSAYTPTISLMPYYTIIINRKLFHYSSYEEINQVCFVLFYHRSNWFCYKWCGEL